MRQRGTETFQHCGRISQSQSWYVILTGCCKYQSTEHLSDLSFQARSARIPKRSGPSFATIRISQRKDRMFSFVTTIPDCSMSPGKLSQNSSMPPSKAVFSSPMPAPVPTLCFATWSISLEMSSSTLRPSMVPVARPSHTSPKRHRRLHT